jgi:hypothetical protein
MEFATRDVYFSRADGHPLRFYIRTLDGYKFAAAPRVDPVYGIAYQPITAAVAKEYLLWQKRGGKMQDPGLPESQFFSPSTGDALRWYTRRPDGRIDVFTLPGFHPTFGTRLLPVDAAVGERDGSVSFPAPGSRGAFVTEFAAPRARTFSLTINDQPVFGAITTGRCL